MCEQQVQPSNPSGALSVPLEVLNNRGSVGAGVKEQDKKGSFLMGLKYTYHTMSLIPEIMIGPAWSEAGVRFRGTGIFWITFPKPSIIPFLV